MFMDNLFINNGPSGKWLLFERVFFKNLSLKITMSGQAGWRASGVGRLARPRFTFLVNLLEKPAHNAIRCFFLFLQKNTV